MKYLVLSGLEKNIAGKTELRDTSLGINVTVRLFGSIRAAAGTDGGEIQGPVDWVAYELLRLLSDTYGDEFRCEVFQQAGDGLRDDLTVSVNGVIMEHAKLKGLRLLDGAVVALLPTFSGGG